MRNTTPKILLRPALAADFKDIGNVLEPVDDPIQFGQAGDFSYQIDSSDGITGSGFGFGDANVAAAASSFIIRWPGAKSDD